MRALSDLEILGLPARMWAGEVTLASITTAASGLAEGYFESPFTRDYVTKWVDGLREHGMSPTEAGRSLLQWAQSDPAATIYVED